MSRSVLLALFLILNSPLRAEDSILLPANAEIRTLLRNEIKGVPDYYRREVKRVGNRTIQFESVMAMPADIKLAPAIFSQFARYGEWVLPGLNERPAGGSFLVQFLDLTVPPDAPDHLVVGYRIDLPFFRKRRQRTFVMKMSTLGDVLTLRGETVKAADGVIAGGSAVMKVFPNERDPSQAWAYVKGQVRIESLIVYEALPEKILARETGDRIRILLDNYAKEEGRKRRSDGGAIKASISSPGPKEKTAAAGGR